MHPPCEDKVTSVAYMVGRLFAAESGDTAARRQAVARKARTAPGTIQNIQRGRLKVVERWEANIRAALIRLLENEIAKAQHELTVARLSADRMDSPAVVAAETDLERRIREAQEALNSRGRQAV